MVLSKVEQILLTVANSDYFESEYDGVMESYCFFCGKHKDEEHEHDCTVLEARAVLGDKWTEYCSDLKKKEDLLILQKEKELKKEIDLQNKRFYLREKVSCEHCNLLVSRGGLLQHQSSEKCLKIRNKIKIKLAFNSYILYYMFIG